MFGFGKEKTGNPIPEHEETQLPPEKTPEINGFVQILFDPNTMQDKVNKVENNLVILDNVDLYAITPGIIDKQGGAPSNVSILVSDKQYTEMVESAKGRACELSNIIKSTDPRATLATVEANGLTGYAYPSSDEQLAPKIAEQLSANSDDAEVLPEENTIGTQK
ncbi:MAG: hypothetical protein Q7S37_03570 [bacterium]|nr:hypothetical protein [bacterium]